MRATRTLVLASLAFSSAACGLRDYVFVPADSLDAVHLDAMADGADRLVPVDAIDVSMDGSDAADIPVDTCTGVCDGACVNLSSDPANCGTCGHACPAGLACVSASCACPTGMALCGGTCIDVTSDVNHCGGCATVCPPPLRGGGAPACAMGMCTFMCNSNYVPVPGGCAPEPPRLVGPMSTTTVGSATPSFDVVPVPGFFGNTVQVCRDPMCLTVVTTYTFGGMRGTITTALTPGVYFWHARTSGGGGIVMPAWSPTWEFVVPHFAGTVTSTRGTMLDTNRDGVPEMLATAPGASEVLIFTDPTTIVATLHGPAGLRFGAQATSAGDLNGDGYGDVVVAGPASGSLPPVVNVYYGGPSYVADPGTTLGTGGPPPAGFGAAVAAAGDVNQDGYGDLAVGAPGANRVFVYYGSATGVPSAPSVTLAPTGSFVTNFGVSLAGSGDVNADGIPDLIVAGGLGTITGVGVALFPGRSGGISTSATMIADPMPLSSDNFGASIATNGDSNGDGVADLAVGAPTATGGGRVYLFTGATTIGAPTTISPPNAGAFGTSVSFAGYATGATLARGDQILVGAPTAGTGGSTYVFHVSGTTVSLDGSLSIPGAMGLGTSVSGIGDSNHDGFDDLLVGAPGSSTAYLVFAGGPVPTFRALAAPTGTSTFGTWVAFAPIASPQPFAL